MKDEITVNDMMKKLHDNGLKIYGDFVTKPTRWAVVIVDNRNVLYKKKVNPGEYKHDGKSVVKACSLALEYCYNKLTNNNK